MAEKSVTHHIKMLQKAAELAFITRAYTHAEQRKYARKLSDDLRLEIEVEPTYRLKDPSPLAVLRGDSQRCVFLDFNVLLISPQVSAWQERFFDGGSGICAGRKFSAVSTSDGDLALQNVGGRLLDEVETFLRPITDLATLEAATSRDEGWVQNDLAKIAVSGLVHGNPTAIAAAEDVRAALLSMRTFGSGARDVSLFDKAIERLKVA